MSYTHKRVIWTSQGSLDTYGDSPASADVTIIARKQPKEEVFKTFDGRELLSKSYYYVDPKVEPNAFQIKRMDRLDGELIEATYDMCDLSNNVVMRRFITV